LEPHRHKSKLSFRRIFHMFYVVCILYALTINVGLVCVFYYSRIYKGFLSEHKEQIMQRKKSVCSNTNITSFILQCFNFNSSGKSNHNFSDIKPSIMIFAPHLNNYSKTIHQNCAERLSGLFPNRPLSILATK
jgi:hypothetical protein